MHPACQIKLEKGFSRVSQLSRIFRVLTVIVCAAVLSNNLAASAFAKAPAEGSNWSHLAALPGGTQIHITGNKKNKTCFFVSVDDRQLICSKGRSRSSAAYTFLRDEVNSVKLTRHAVSTVAGLGIGAGVGLGVGAGVGHAVVTPTGGFLDFSSFGREFITGVGAGAGLVSGAVIGGLTDFLRGPTVYLRPIPVE
jgi:hypothetical protein